MDSKVRYTQPAPFKGNSKGTTIAFVFLALAVIILLIIANLLPYSGLLSLGVLALGAYGTYRLLSAMVFDITYALYDDRLLFVRRYGRLEYECEVFPLDEAEFSPGEIIHRGKTYKFYPDDTLCSLLGI